MIINYALVYSRPMSSKYVCYWIVKQFKIYKTNREATIPFLHYSNIIIIKNTNNFMNKRHIIVVNWRI